MSIDYHDIYLARVQAEDQIKTADNAVQSAAKLVAGRLRIASVNPYVLQRLKRELAQFDAVKRQWKP